MPVKGKNTYILLLAIILFTIEYAVQYHFTFENL